jgi:hypothetical protein
MKARRTVAPVQVAILITTPRLSAVVANLFSYNNTLLLLLITVLS